MLQTKDGPGMVPHPVFAIILGLLFLAGGFGTNGTVSAQESPDDGTSSERSTIYDLPSGGGKNPSEDDDYTDVIQVFGAEIFADSYYLCVEHTEWMKGERASVISAEFGNLVSSLSGRSRFGAVIFNETLHLFRNRPVSASPTNKTLMKNWEASKEHSGASSMALALEETLKIAHLDRTKHRAVILIIDDRYSFGEIQLDALTIAIEQNRDDLPIHVFFITSEVSDEFLETTCRFISSVSGGQFRRIPITPDPGQPLLPPPPTSPT
ncbi:MAG: hypothetical protein VX764_10845 [Planctomycetota bacterium]|nr:hypothetical protein [Planctomycetota bacterium]